MQQEQVVQEVREAIGADAEGVNVVVKLFFPAAEGGHDHALYRTIERVMGELDPGCRVVPYLLVGVSVVFLVLSYLLFEYVLEE